MKPTIRQQQAADAWSDYCESLKAAGQQLLRTDFPIDDLDLAEGLRYLSRLLFTSIERSIEGADPGRPYLYVMCNERIKVGGDNPDNRYYAAAISHRYRYMLRGDFRRCSYYSIVTTGKVDGTESVVCGSLNSKTALAGSDGITEIVLTVDGAGSNCVEMDERTTMVIVRCTIEDPVDKDIRPTLVRIDDEEEGPALSMDSVTRALQQSSAFVRNISQFFGNWTAEFQSHANTLPAYRDQNYLVSIGGDPNIRYYLSAWAIDAHQCLEIHIPELPDCMTWNCQLCNVWLESLDYTLAQIHVNSRTVTRDTDGGITLMVSERDPEHPNWLRTLGHRQGTLCMRIVGAKGELLAHTRVVDLEQREMRDGHATGVRG